MNYLEQKSIDNMFVKCKDVDFEGRTQFATSTARIKSQIVMCIGGLESVSGCRGGHPVHQLQDLDHPSFSPTCGVGV